MSLLNCELCGTVLQTTTTDANGKYGFDVMLEATKCRCQANWLLVTNKIKVRTTVPIRYQHFWNDWFGYSCSRRQNLDYRCRLVQKSSNRWPGLGRFRPFDGVRILANTVSQGLRCICKTARCDYCQHYNQQLPVTINRWRWSRKLIVYVRQTNVLIHNSYWGGTYNMNDWKWV